MSVGDRIKGIREEKKISKNQLSKDLGVDRKTLDRWERNESDPSVEQVQKIAELTETPISDIIDLDSKDSELIRQMAKRIDGISSKIDAYTKTGAGKEQTKISSVLTVVVLAMSSCITWPYPNLSFLRISVGLIPSAALVFLSFRNQYHWIAKILGILLLGLNLYFSWYNIQHYMDYVNLWHNITTP